MGASVAVGCIRVGQRPILPEACLREGIFVVNSSICIDCHRYTWREVVASKHGVFWNISELSTSSGLVKVDKCSTCHNHYENNLLVKYVSGTVLKASFDEYMRVCEACHRV